MGIRCHLLTSLQGEDDWRSHIGSSDTVIDLTLQTAGVLSSAHSVISTEVATRPVHDDALSRYHRWMVAALTAGNSNAPPLVELLAYRDEWSLGWLLPFASRHYTTLRLPKLVQQLTWLETSDRDHPAWRALEKADELVIWDDDSRACRHLEEAIETRLSRRVVSDHLSPEGDPHAIDMGDGRRSLPALMGRPVLKGLYFAMREAWRGDAHRRGNPRASNSEVDVVLATVERSWRDEEQDAVPSQPSTSPAAFAPV